MKFLLPILLGLLQAVSVPAQSPPAASASPAAESQKCSVSGTVFRKDTGEPLSKAKVQLVNREKWEESTFDLTDSQGNFQVNDLDCHSYLIKVSHLGFVEASYGQQTLSDPGAVLTLIPGQKVADLVFKLQRTAIVTGRVFDENGQLAEGVSIHVIHLMRRGAKKDYEETNAVTTNDLGEFRIFGLEPGHYLFAAVYDPWPWREGLDPKPRGKLLKQGYPVIFYPNATDPSRAQSFTIVAGQELSSIDFQMQLTSMNTVSGKILTVPGNKKDGESVLIYLVPEGGAFSGISLNDLESHTRNGSFTIGRVPPGSYTLQGVYTDLEWRQPVWAQRKIEVNGADLEGLTLSFVAGFPLRGHVIWEGGRPADTSGKPYVYLYSTDDSFRFLPSTDVKPDDTFVFRNMTDGEYLPAIRAGNDEDCFVKSARLGSVSVVDRKIQIPSGTDSTLEYVVSCRAAHLEGQVLTSDSLPAVGVYVALVPEERLPENRTIRSYDQTDQTGHFLLKGILPGNYKLFSWSHVEEGAWEDPEFLRPFEDNGVSVHLEQGDHKSVNVTLIDTSADTSPKQ
jgi:Carboxypeptidase regulatory-like domain